MERFWNIMGGLLDYFEYLGLVLLFAALAFSVGYHMGFSVGLDTKVTWVGDQYTMKLTGNGRR